MITEKSEVKVIDFDFGKELKGNMSTGFMNTPVGTPMYMAPQVTVDRIKYQGQDADIFAFGVMLLATRIGDYPWKVPTLEDENYRYIAQFGGLNVEEFWKKYAHRNVTPEFKSFITTLIAFEPSSRPTMADILGDPWMRGEVLTHEQFANMCKPIFKKAVKSQQETLIDSFKDHIDFQVDK